MAEPESTRACGHCGHSFKIPHARPRQRFCSNVCSTTARSPNPVDRFWARVERREENDCWPWTGPLYRGYGRISVKDKNVQTHRFSWELHNGPIPEGLFVCHKCDNPPCCNPAHFFLGTNAENTADKIAKGRARYLHGEDNPMSKLTARDVLAIRAAHGSQAAIGAMFGIAQTMVGQIRRGIRWKHLLPSAGQNPENLALLNDQEVSSVE